jgi:RNA polymerase sigma-70 factor (ECF subfamily)
MPKTPASLIFRLRNPGDAKAYEDFVALFHPLMIRWSGRMGFHGADADDLVQDVLVTALERLPQFDYDPKRSFRAWLRAIMTNKGRERRKLAYVRKRVDVNIDDVPDRDNSAADNAVYADEVLKGALSIVESEVKPTTFRAFILCKHEQKSAKEVAIDLNMKVDAVHRAVFRVMQRLRTLLEGVIEW